MISGAHRVLLFLRASRVPVSLETIRDYLDIPGVGKTLRWLADRDCLEQTDSNLWKITDVGVMEIYKLAERFEPIDQRPARRVVAPSG
jgi:hypothetical protein